jgi:Fic family protein
LPSDKRDDWEEVQNYIKAMKWAIEHLDKLPFSSQLIRETHRVLLQGVRGEKKQPGVRMETLDGQEIIPEYK